MNQSKFQTEFYNISIVGKHVEVTDAMKHYALDKISKVERFADHILDVEVVMDIQKLQQSVSILMKFSHFKIKVQATAEDMYSAIDKATDKLIALIRKYKSKLLSHRVFGISEADQKAHILTLEEETLEEINDEIEEENLKEQEAMYSFGKITSRQKLAPKMLRREEALMKIDLSSDPCLIYREEEDQKMKVLFRRGGDNFGLIEVE